MGNPIYGYGWVMGTVLWCCQRCWRQKTVGTNQINLEVIQTIRLRKSGKTIRLRGNDDKREGNILDLMEKENEVEKSK